MTLTPGTVLGDYEILAALGSGGMGEVYLARDRQLNRKVAVKVLPAALTYDQRRVSRFEHEARSASSLSHPNVCVVHALGVAPDGRRFIAMEYVDGMTLRQRLSRGPVPLEEAVGIAAQIADGLAAAHANQIVHRDLKPENVIVRPDGLAKILDFGLAKLTAEGGGDEATRTLPQTDPGTVLGTVLYMSPEQARGQEVDERTDIWSLGVMLYEMVAGRVPFKGSTGSDTMVAILTSEPPALVRIGTDIPRECQRIVTKALRKDREQRYQNVKDLKLDLKALEGELRNGSRQRVPGPLPDSWSQLGAAGAVPTPIPAQAASSAEYLFTHIWRQKTALGLAAGALLLGIATVAWWSTRPQVRPGAPSARTLTRLTFGAGLQTDVTFSPDGRFIAYSSDRSGNFDIWVQPVAGGAPVQVTKSPAADTEPDWSPDGSTIAFHSQREGDGIYVVPALGGVERQLTHFGVHPRWSGKGPEILFLVGASVDSGENNLELYSVTADTEPQAVLTNFLREGTWLWIGAHPDGRISAFGRRPSGPGFYTVSRDGKSVIRSAQNPAVPLHEELMGNWPARFEWNASGTALFLGGMVNGVENLWRVRVNPQTLEWVSAERLTTGPGRDVAARVSADGTRVAFSTLGQATRLWLFPFDAATGKVSGSGTPVTEEQAAVSESALSPDGRRVVYSLTRQGSNRVELHILDLESNVDEVLFSDDEAPLLSFAWSPDSTRFAYHVLRVDAAGQLKGSRMFVRPLQGREQPLGPLTKNFAFLPSDWTADGRSILGSYVTNIEGTSDHVPLALWTPTSGNPPNPQRLLEQADRFFWQPTLSPNGRWISFVEWNPDVAARLAIRVAPAAGGRAKDWASVASSHPWPDKPRWSPDGRTLYFLSRGSSSFFNVWGTKFDADRGVPLGEPFEVTHFDSPNLIVSTSIDKTEMDLSSHRLLLTMVTAAGGIWMLDNMDK